MKRALVYWLALGGIAVASAPASAQAPAAPAAAPAPAANPNRVTGRVAVFNVAKVMRDYKNWQHFANVMNAKRTAATADLGKARTAIAELQQKMQLEPSKTIQEQMSKQLIELQRQFEDKERTARTSLDQESAGYLRNMFAQIQACVKAIVDSQGWDIVMAYPDALTEEELKSPLYYDLKLRPPAAMPFYISPTADITQTLIDTLNANFKPPADSPANVPPAGPAAAGATTPGAPPAPPK